MRVSKKKRKKIAALKMGKRKLISYSQMKRMMITPLLTSQTRIKRKHL